MPRITLIEVFKYRDWTEELGFDREGLIQVKQSSIYKFLQEEFWSRNCFVLPFRYDYYVALSNGMSRDELEGIVRRAAGVAPYGVRAASVVHKYPASAILKATSLARSSELYYEDGVEDEVVVSHIDLNNVTELSMETSVYESYVEVLALNYYVAKYVLSLGGIASYAGGDNLIAVLPIDRHEELLEVLPSYLKVGVGVSRLPRRALELSTRALTSIRKREVSKNYYVLYDSA